jgi:hypothetical protein
VTGAEVVFENSMLIGFGVAMQADNQTPTIGRREAKRIADPF